MPVAAEAMAVLVVWEGAELVITKYRFTIPGFPLRELPLLSPVLGVSTSD